jgi:hypothetical protein
MDFPYEIKVRFFILTFLIFTQQKLRMTLSSCYEYPVVDNSIVKLPENDVASSLREQEKDDNETLFYALIAVFMKRNNCPVEVSLNIFSFLKFEQSLRYFIFSDFHLEPPVRHRCSQSSETPNSVPSNPS